MNHKARNELIEVISGLVMLVAGIFLIVSKTKIVSGFLGGNGYMEKLAEISCIISTYRWHHHDDNQAKTQSVQNNFVCRRYDDNSNSFY